MQVNITKRIDTLEGRRYCPILIDLNGHVQADWVTVNGHQERHPEGTYYLDWSEDGKRRRISVGSDAIAAHKSCTRKQRELNAIEPGLIRPSQICTPR